MPYPGRQECNGVTSRKARTPVDVVIVGKTLTGSTVCIGALTTRDWMSIRLLTPRTESYWPDDTEFEIGQVWTVTGTRSKSSKPPHTEDVVLDTFNFSREYGPDLPQHILQRLNVARNFPGDLFDGMLVRKASGSMRIERDNVPNFSTQFWIPSFPLKLQGKHFSSAGLEVNCKIPFVGFQEGTSIEAGSLVRLSLSRWFTPESEDEDGCYLQLSGWWSPPRPGISW